MGALSVGDVRTGTIPSLLPSQKHYLKVYKYSSTEQSIHLYEGDRSLFRSLSDRQPFTVPPGDRRVHCGYPFVWSCT
ncbi:MAG: hypothetical protein V1736_03300 [Pseudomonadota bacterium]